MAIELTVQLPAQLARAQHPGAKVPREYQQNGYQQERVRNKAHPIILTDVPASRLAGIAPWPGWVAVLQRSYSTEGAAKNPHRKALFKTPPGVYMLIQASGSE